MNIQNNFILIIFIFITIVILNSWNMDSKNNKFNKINNFNSKKIIKKFNKNDILTIKTDVLLININVNNGEIVKVTLLKYLNKSNNKKLTLIKDNLDFIYKIKNEIYLNNKYYKPVFIDDSRKIRFYELKNNNFLNVKLNYKLKNGVIYTKIFKLKKGKYDINICYKVFNNENKKISVNLFGKIIQSIDILNKYNYIDGEKNNSYRNISLSYDDKKFSKYNFNDINKNINIKTKNGWISMMSKYFLTALIMDVKNTYYDIHINKTNNLIYIDFISKNIYILPKNNISLNSILWVGPKLQNEITKINPYLGFTIDYGMLWFISKPLFKLLLFLNKFLKNWGFSIIFETFIVRLLMYPLTKSQYNSMSKMKKLQPKLNSIKKMHSDNGNFNKEIMNLYKKEKINPFGGCLPVIMQMPIFLGLYYMLINSIELRQAPFILWIKDLSSQDPYYILPIIMGITMFFLQKLSNNNKNMKIMILTPIIFTTFFLWLPSGLVIYYIISNIITIIQQKFIFNKFK